MKNDKLAFTLLLICLILLVLFYGGSQKENRRDIKLLHEAQNVALSEYYRRIIGFDSVQMIFFQGKWEANFCYPNEWEQEKFKIYLPDNTITLPYPQDDSDLIEPYEKIPDSPKIMMRDLMKEYQTDKNKK